MTRVEATWLGERGRKNQGFRCEIKDSTVADKTRHAKSIQRRGNHMFLTQSHGPNTPSPGFGSRVAWRRLCRLRLPCHRRPLSQHCCYWPGSSTGPPRETRRPHQIPHFRGWCCHSGRCCCHWAIRAGESECRWRRSTGGERCWKREMKDTLEEGKERHVGRGKGKTRWKRERRDTLEEGKERHVGRGK